MASQPRDGRPAPDRVRAPDVSFAPRLGARRVVGVMTLVSLLATAYVGWLVADHRTVLRTGCLGVLALLTLLLWAVRASSPTTTLRIVSGQLEVVRGGRREVVDLAGRWTPIEVTGRPGRWGWRVRIGRLDGPPLVIDSSVVDPRAFSEALLANRPDLAGSAPSSDA